MKRITLLIASAIMLFVSCDKEDDSINKECGVTTLEITEVGMASATVTGKVVLPEQIAMDFEIGFEISPTQTFEEESVIKYAAKAYDKNFQYTVTLDRLHPDSTYYVRAYMINQMCFYDGEVKSFRTNIPTITTGDIDSMVVYTSVVVTNTVNIGDMNPSELFLGVCWSKTNSTPTIEDAYATTDNICDDGSFSIEMNELAFGLSYYYRAFIITGSNVFYGEMKTLNTFIPTIRTGDIESPVKNARVVVTNTVSIGDQDPSDVLFGICWSSTNMTPTIDDLRAFTNVVDTNNNYKIALSGLTSNTTYYYRSFIFTNAEPYYGEVQTFYTVDFTYPKEYVDLGLSVKWATCNIGATCSEDYGDYFAWGETQAKSDYSWSTYKYCNGSKTTLTKYCNDSSYGIVDGKTVLAPEDDAAHVNWGDNWHMPTDNEFQELKDKCTWTWTTQNVVYGYKVVSKINGNSIFLPFAGYRSGTSPTNDGNSGNYWTSSVYSYYDYEAWYLDIECGIHRTSLTSRSYGQSVRPVCE